jgi:integrase
VPKRQAKPKKRLNGEGSVYPNPRGPGLIIAWRDGLTASGRPRRRTEVVQVDPKAAEQLLDDRIAAAGRGESAPGRAYSVKHLLRDWRKDHWPTLEPATRRRHDSVIRRLLEPAFGASPVTSITKRRVNAWVRARSQSVKPQTVRNDVRVLTAALTWAVKNDILAEHPIPENSLQFPELVHEERDALPIEAANRFLGAAKDNPLYAYWLIEATIGPRPGEGIALSWDNVDLERKQIGLVGQIIRAYHTGFDQETGEAVHWYALELSGTKTDESPRIVAITDDIVAALRERRTVAEEERRRAGGRWHSEWDAANLVFRRPNGLPITSDVLSGRYQTIAGRAGLADTVAYQLRHTAGSYALAGGADLLAVVGMMGHTTGDQLLTRYGHDMPETVRAAVEASERVRVTGQTGPLRARKGRGVGRRG